MKDFLEQLNRAPVTYGVLAAYLLLGVTTGVFEVDGLLLRKYGAAIGILVMDGEPWRLVTHCFLHGGFLHLLFNSYALYVLGPALERNLGSLKYGILYLVAGIMGGVVGSLWHHPCAPLVGGSGALFGMMGAMLAIMLRGGRNIFEAIQFHGTKQILGMIAINLVIGWLIPFISNAAHIGGLLAGFVLCFCFLDRGRARMDKTSRATQIAWAALYLSLVFYAINPVHRWDYQARAFYRATSDEMRLKHRKFARASDDALFIEREREWRR